MFFRRGQLQDQDLTADHISIEALSDTKDQNIVHVGGNGFVMACVTAFAQHLPLTLAPDHVWILISYAFAKHVDQNAEALRENFVQHQGKKRLLVDTPANFAMSCNRDPDGLQPKTGKPWYSPHFRAKFEHTLVTKYIRPLPQTSAPQPLRLGQLTRSHL